jgi:hypothetical protein
MDKTLEEMRKVFDKYVEINKHNPYDNMIFYLNKDHYDDYLVYVKKIHGKHFSNKNPLTFRSIHVVQTQDFDLEIK